MRCGSLWPALSPRKCFMDQFWFLVRFFHFSVCCFFLFVPFSGYSNFSVSFDWVFWESQGSIGVTRYHYRQKSMRVQFFITFFTILPKTTAMLFTITLHCSKWNEYLFFFSNKRTRKKDKQKKIEKRNKRTKIDRHFSMNVSEMLLM